MTGVTINLRGNQTSPLSNAQMDANFQNLKDSADANADAVSTIVQSSAVSTLSYGIATGVLADQTAALNAAIADAATRGLRLVLSGRIRIDGQVLLPKRADLVGQDSNAILDASYSALSLSQGNLSALGTLGPALPVTAALARWSNTVPVPGHGLSVGDWFRVISTVDANSAAAGDDRLGDRADVVYLTETHQVSSVPDVNTIKTAGALRYAYPIGSAIKKINGVTGIRLRGFKIEHASKANPSIMLTLCDGAIVEGVEVMRAGGEIAVQGCFNGTRIEANAWGDLTTANSGSPAKIKVLDGSVGVVVHDSKAKNGGQLIDITYSPGLTNTLAAPCLDTVVENCELSNAFSSAVTDHPCCDGTIVRNNTFLDVKGAVYIRSRNSKVIGNRGWGSANYGDSTCIGVWLGENGYWAGAEASGNDMHGFENGYYVGGSASTLGRADAQFTNNKSHYCTIGENWFGAPSGQNDCGVRATGSQHIFPIATGIRIDPRFTGIQLKGWTVRGPVSGAAVEIAGSLVDAEVEGTVLDIGSTRPALYVSSGAPLRLTADIKRRGACGLNSGVTSAMLRPTVRRLYSDSAESVLTGVTSTTTVKASVGAIPAGALDASASVRVRIFGTRVGSAGAATIAIRPPEANVFASLTLPAGTAGDFVAEFELFGTGPATQKGNTTGIIAGGASVVRAGVNNSNYDYSGGMATLPLQVTLSNSADTVKIESVVTEASWA